MDLKDIVIFMDLKFSLQVRDNILFGLAFESARYEKTIDVTALQPDLDILPVSIFV